MPPSSTPSSQASQQILKSKTTSVWIWGSLAAVVLILYWFYGMVPRFGPDRTHSAFTWLGGTWNDETDYEHGLLFPFVIAGLIIYRFKELRGISNSGSAWGLVPLVAGVLFYLIAYRTFQPRIAMGGLPWIVWGSVWCVWGWQVAKALTFPIFFFLLAIPLPGFQQATTHLQLLATSFAHHGSGLFGVETYVEGTTVLPLKGDWKPLDIAKGCSGIRSLMALLMISAAWAYIAKIAIWKKVLLFSAAFPLAIIGNALRVTSIFVIAEYGDEKWASTTWHDWSGLLLFYPFSLAVLLLIHSVLEGGLPWKKINQKQLRRVVVTTKEASASNLSES